MKIAGIQFACNKNKDKNMKKAGNMLDIAINEGAKIICFQELFNLYWFPYSRDEEAFHLAEEIEGESVTLIKEKIKNSDIVVLLPIFERDGSRYYKSCVVIQGEKTLGVYRTIHIPDIPLWEEKFYFSTGDKGLSVFETIHGKFGIQISWDNLFNEGTRALALQGADIVFAPTACAFKSQHIWQTVISANAITNGIYIMRINRVGSETSQDFYGMSFCVNPEGELIGGPTARGDSVLLADIDFEYLKHIRREWPLMSERKPAFYHDLIREA